MKQWYLFYIQGEEEILHQAGAELQRIKNQYVIKLHQVGGEFPLPLELSYKRSRMNKVDILLCFS